MNPHSPSTQSLEDASEQLMLLLSKNQGPEPLIELAKDLLDNPVAVGDTSLTILYASKDMPPRVPMSAPGMIPPEFTTDKDFIRYNEAAYGDDAPIVTHPQFGGYRTVLTRLKVHRQIVGYMSVLLARHELRPGDMELICLIRSAVEAELGKNTSVLSQPPRPSEYTLKHLLSGQENPLQNNADLTISLGIDKNARLYVLVFKVIGYSRANTPGLAIRRELLSLCGAKISVVYESNIVILYQGALNSNENLCPPYTKLHGFLRKYGIACGISTCFNQITELHRYYLQALDTLQYFIPREGPGIYRYEQAAVPLFLKKRSLQEDLMVYCHPGIVRLAAYDQQNHTKYTSVLKIYVESEKNALLTAQKTGLSKASIYRILERIKTITGETLEAPSTLFNLYFSIRLIEQQQEAEYA